MDKIHLTGMRFYGYHGCLAFEAEEGQPFIVDLALELDLAPAGHSDNLNDTVNYAAVFDAVKAIVEGERFNLIEALAENIAAALLANFANLSAVTVTIHKPEAPIQGKFEDVAVEMRRGR